MIWLRINDENNCYSVSLDKIFGLLLKYTVSTRVEFIPNCLRVGEHCVKYLRVALQTSVLDIVIFYYHRLHCGPARRSILSPRCTRVHEMTPGKCVCVCACTIERVGVVENKMAGCHPPRSKYAHIAFGRRHGHRPSLASRPHESGGGGGGGGIRRTSGSARAKGSARGWIYPEKTPRTHALYTLEYNVHNGGKKKKIIQTKTKMNASRIRPGEDNKTI